MMALQRRRTTHAEALRVLLDPPRPVTVVLGEPGIGKTTLLRSVREQATSQVFSVACKRIARDIRLEPLTVLAQTAARSSGKTLRPRPPNDAERLLDVRTMLEQATAYGPVVVQLDDLQWADGPTLSALPYLVERLVDFPIHWHLSARTGFDDVENCIAQLRRSRRAVTLELGPFDQSEIAAIVERHAGDLSQEERDALITRAKGNPLYAELLSSAATGETHDLAQAARDHILDLPPEALPVAAALAVRGAPASVETIAFISRMSPKTTKSHIDLLVERAIFEERNGSFRIRHDVLADAIIEYASPETLQLVHSAAADAASNDRERAHHLLAAHRIAEARVCLASVAWKALINSDWTDARDLFTQLASAEPCSADPVLAQADHVRQALRLLQRFTSGSGPLSAQECEAAWGHLPRDVRIRLELAHLRVFAGEANLISSENLARLFAMTQDASTDVAVMLIIAIGHVARRVRNRELESDAFQRMHALLDHVEDPELRQNIALETALHVMSNDSWDQGLAQFEEAAQRSIAEGHTRVAGRAIRGLLSAAIRDGKTADGLTWAAVARDLKDVDANMRANIRVAEATLLSDAGRLREAISILSSLGDTLIEGRFGFLSILIEVATKLGLAERARAAIAEYRASGAQATSTEAPIALFHILLGDLDTARRILTQTEAAAITNSMAHCFSLVMRAQIALKMRDSKQMEIALARRDGLRASGSLPIVGCADWIDGCSLALSGDEDGALRSFRLAFERIAFPFDRGQILWHMAEITNKSDDYEAARRAFAAIGSEYMAQRVADAASKSGMRLTRRKRSAMVLTERERTIALMVAEGNTNAEIAQSLSISKRTADSHIDHIRTKLCVRSRVEVAMLVAKGGAFTLAP
jgi:DNA-binding CsgD family transcriptional regulator